MNQFPQDDTMEKSQLENAAKQTTTTQSVKDLRSMFEKNIRRAETLKSNNEIKPVSDVVGAK